jgi:hypothetical protein
LRFVMAKLHKKWTVLPHGSVEEVGEGILTVQGVIPLPLGKFPRRMTAVALSGGRSAIFSAMALDDRGMRRIEALGAPSFLIVPNGFHRTDAFSWKQRYPQMKVVCPPGAAKRVAKAVTVDATTDILDDDQVQFLIVPGTGEAEAALSVRRADGTTLVVNDIIANVRHPPGFGAQVMARLFGFGVKRPQVPREVKWLFLKDRSALAAQLREWAAVPELRRLIPSHGEIIDRPQRSLERIAESLS